MKRRPYLLRGNSKVFRDSVQLTQNLDILSIGLDVNGNPIIRMYSKASGKKRTMQIPYSISISANCIIYGLSAREVNVLTRVAGVHGLT